MGVVEISGNNKCTTFKNSLHLSFEVAKQKNLEFCLFLYLLIPPSVFIHGPQRNRKTNSMYKSLVSKFRQDTIDIFFGYCSPKPGKNVDYVPHRREGQVTRQFFERLGAYIDILSKVSDAENKTNSMIKDKLKMTEKWVCQSLRSIPVT